MMQGIGRLPGPSEPGPGALGGPAAGGAGRPFALDADGEAAESGHEKAGERFVSEVGGHAGPSCEDVPVYDARRRRGAVSGEALLTFRREPDGAFRERSVRPLHP